MKNFYEINRALVAKKKIFTLFVIVLLGMGQVWAQLPYNTTYTKSHFNDNQVTVAKDGANWDNSDGVRLGNATWGGFNWDDKYIVIALDQKSIPNQLNFKYKVSSTAVSDPKWYVAESPDNSTWTEIWTATPATTTIITVSTDWVDSNPLTLSKSTKYIKLCYSGNFAGYLSDIIVSDQAYVNNPKVGDEEITSLDFGAGNISSGKAELSFDVEWCNVEALNVTSNNALFTVTPASFGGKAKYGTQTITVGYNRDKEVGEHNGMITITNGSVTKNVAVSGSTTKREQAIHWNADLEATNFTMNAEDVLTGADLATADNEDGELTYASNDANVIAVSEDGKTLYAIANGKAMITATATGNNIYNEKIESKEFTVTSNKKQIIVWDQNFMGLKTNADPNTIELTATATSGGAVTYALEDGSDDCVTLNGSTLTITGTPGVAYVIASQAGGEINGEVWIAAQARKQIKVRDPHSACDEYALADAQYTFEKGDKGGMVNKEFNLEGKPTQLTFYAKRGSLKYIWESQTPLYIDQYANYGSGLEWKQIESIMPTENGGNFGPYALDETATKIRFRTGEYAEQAITNISVPRKKEFVVSETDIEENAERNVRWAKTISVSRSNIDVVDIMVESSDPECPFEVSKTSIGIDCADRGTETFEVFITPRERNKVYTGTITITDGKAVPTTHIINLRVETVGFNQSIIGFELPESCFTTDIIDFSEVTATSGLEVSFISSNEEIAYVENNVLVILASGTVDITAIQEGDDRYNETSEKKTIEIKKAPVEILEAPTATAIKAGEALSESVLTGGSASVEGSFAWQNPELVPTAGSAAYPVVFTPKNGVIYAETIVEVEVHVARNSQTITWDEELPRINAGDRVELHATASSGLTVTFTTSDSDIAYYDAEEGVLVAVAPGTVTISAVQAGNDDFDAADPVKRIINIQDPGDTREEQFIIWEDELPVMNVEDEEYQIIAYATSGLEVSFLSSDSTIAYVDEYGWINIVFRPGTVLITAIQEGDEYYKPAEPVAKTLVIKGDDQSGISDEAEVIRQAQKIFRSNRILIIRDGKTYTVNGQLVQ
jgi:hypothetical protein